MMFRVASAGVEPVGFEESLGLAGFERYMETRKRYVQFSSMHKVVRTFRRGSTPDCSSSPLAKKFALLVSSCQIPSPNDDC